MAETIDELTDVFRQVFNDDELTLSPELTANEVEGWDSFTHVNLIMAIELRFGIKFKQKEIYGFANVGDLLKCVQEKVVAKS
jgi:acyl carrier protein